MHQSRKGSRPSIGGSLGREESHLSKTEMANGALLEDLQTRKVDWVVLAGFLLKVPKEVCEAYEGRMVNIHPALLPKHGGTGMFGMHVHRAVKEAGDLVSGMTIHFVNEDYDEGDVVFQAEVDLAPEDALGHRSQSAGVGAPSLRPGAGGIDSVDARHRHSRQHALEITQTLRPCWSC